MIKLIEHCKRVTGRCFFHFLSFFLPTGKGAFLKSFCVKLQGAKVAKNVHFSYGLYLHRAINTEFDSNSNIGLFFHCIDIDNIFIGKNCLIASDVNITSGSHKLNSKRTAIKGEVRIGKNVWIGTSVSIIGPSIIGDNVVIAAHSFVKGNIPANVVVGGCPARILKTLPITND